MEEDPLKNLTLGNINSLQAKLNYQQVKKGYYGKMGHNVKQHFLGDRNGEHFRRIYKEEVKKFLGGHGGLKDPSKRDVCEGHI